MKRNRSLRKTIDEGAKLNIGVANAVAAAMKDWAIAHGASRSTRRACRFRVSMERRRGVFLSMVFDDRVMKANLSAEVYQSLKRTIDQGEKLNIGVANAEPACSAPPWSAGAGSFCPGLPRCSRRRRWGCTGSCP